MWSASWFHDGSAQGPVKTGYGNNWVVLGIVCRLPMVRRPVAVPVLAKLVIKDTNSASRLWLARRMAVLLAGALPGRDVHVVADSAYAGGDLKDLPPGVTWTTRLRKDARAVRPAPGPHRQARRAPKERGPAPLPGGTRPAAGFTPGHRHTLRQGPDRQRGRGHLPVVLGLPYPARHRRAHPRQVKDRLRPGPGHHRHRPPAPPRSSSATQRGGAIEVGHRWHRSSRVAFSLLCSLFLVGFLLRLCPAGAGVEAGRACPAFA